MTSNSTTGAARVLLVALAFAGVATAAAAQSDLTVSSSAQTRQATVAFGDLNISDARGRAMLEHRISAAADEVCSADALYTPFARGDLHQCRVSAISGARTQIEHRLAMGDTRPLRLRIG